MKVLQFGGGKDSLACLHLLKPEWDGITVVWLNTGASFPETMDLMRKVREEVPHFLEVQSDVLADIDRNGWPSDVVPTASTQWGKNGTLNPGIKVRSWVECCYNNFWQPLETRMREMGVTTIVRGQRNAEHYKSPIRSGHVENGITYEFPIQDWTDAEVFHYLQDNDIEVPAYYGYTGTSLDCWNCTAYLDSKGGQLDYMKQHHPEKYSIVRSKLGEIREQITGPLANIDRCLA